LGRNTSIIITPTVLRFQGSSQDKTFDLIIFYLP
jgi:hypothetical protein